MYSICRTFSHGIWHSLCHNITRKKIKMALRKPQFTVVNTLVIISDHCWLNLQCCTAHTGQCWHSIMPNKNFCRTWLPIISVNKENSKANSSAGSHTIVSNAALTQNQGHKSCWRVATTILLVLDSAAACTQLPLTGALSACTLNSGFSLYHRLCSTAALLNDKAPSRPH